MPSSHPRYKFHVFCSLGSVDLLHGSLGAQASDCSSACGNTDTEYAMPIISHLPSSDRPSDGISGTGSELISQHCARHRSSLPKSPTERRAVAGGHSNEQLPMSTCGQCPMPMSSLVLDICKYLL